MKKVLVILIASLIVIGVLTASTNHKAGIAIVGVATPSSDEGESIVNELTTLSKDQISKIPDYEFVAKIPEAVLKELKLKLLEGKKFPPEIEEKISPTFLLFIKVLSMKGEWFASVSLVNMVTGEIIGTKTFPVEKGNMNVIKKEISQLLLKAAKPLPPETKIYKAKGGIWLQVVASGKGMGPVSIAKKVALIDAKRRAVEKAVGSVVNIKIVPEEKRREIISKTQGYLKYSIVSSGKKGKFYSVTISASVLVPEEYVKKFPVYYSRAPIATGMPPLKLAPVKGVSVNWEKGIILAEGSGKINEDKLLEGRRAAIVDAQGKALEALKGIRVQRNKKAEDFGLGYHLRGLVRSGDVVKEWVENGFYHVVLRVPVYGISGLTGLLSDESINAPFSSILKNSRAETNLPYTGIVIDATGVKVLPAVVVEVYDEDGTPLYSLGNVDPSAFRDMGMASFVVKEGSDMELWREGNLGFPIYIASRVDYIFLARRRWRKSHRSYYRKKWWYRFRRRQGRRPLRVRAIRLPRHGKIRTGVVISSRRGKISPKLLKKIFRTAKVVVITQATVGGTEGLKYSPVWVGGLW